MLTDNFSYFPPAAHQSYSSSWTSEQIRVRISLNNDLLICAWENEQIAGMVSGTKSEGGVGTIIWLTISPSFQSRGIGSKLLDKAREFYRQEGAHKIKLTVHDSRALKFYQREGFIKESLHVKHWWKIDFHEVCCFLT
jgi:ribosomal protein S18 acetylase RimI-like enzyme